jgi:hypothetical protein
MNSRRFMSDMGASSREGPWGGPVRSVYRTISLPQRDRQVLGPDLNCSELRRARPSNRPRPIATFEVASCRSGADIRLPRGLSLEVVTPLAVLAKPVQKSRPICANPKSTKSTVSDIARDVPKNRWILYVAVPRGVTLSSAVKHLHWQTGVTTRFGTKRLFPAVATLRDQ